MDPVVTEPAPPAPLWFLAASRWRPAFGRIDVVLLALLALGTWLRAFHLAEPEGSLIFDEAYYVQDARVILGHAVLPTNLPPHAQSGIDPNAEHPPLAKLVMAAAMYLVGPTAAAWRLPSVLLGVLSIWLVYRLVFAVGGDRSQARMAAFVLTFDNLAFVHGRIATLDIYVMAFMLLGTLLYVTRWYELAGLALGVATLCKVNGLFGVLAILLFEVGLRLQARREQRRAPSLAPFCTMAVIYVAFTLCVLGALDCKWTAFRSPLTHLAHIFKYGASLTRTVGGAQGAESTPLQWWLNESPMSYLMVQTSTDGIDRTAVLFRGAMTEYVIFAAPFALVMGAVAAWRGSRFSLLATCLFAANYLPLLFAWALASRISYFYYILQALPAIALSIGFVSPTVPRLVRYTFVVAVLFSFATWFPFRWY